SLKGTMAGCDAVIHLVGIIDEKPSKGVTFDSVHFEGTRAVVDEARRAGIERFVQMSANGARPNGVSSYQTSKWKAEEYVRKAAFQHWTVLRPSTIFGDPGEGNPEFAVQLARQLVKPFPILPVFGRGDFKMQPVSVGEVAAAFVQSLTRDSASGKSYCVAGKEEITFVDLLDRITEAVGHARKPKLPQPLWLVRPAVKMLGRIGLLPITSDQLEMLVEGNTCDSTAFYRDFDVVFKPFIPENLQYIRRRS
ncbi:MAG: NAD-dependent epimerase/dehydratase family protein, partial [Rhodothermales bacterium]